MPLVCLGLSHHTAPVEVRERHAFPASRMAESLVALRDYELVREAVMLSTCGRLEIYAELDDYEAGVVQLKRFLRNFRHGDVQLDMSSYLYTLLGTQAVDHLVRVATGLDSMLIGEAEILGQVKDAYIQAQNARSLGKTLHALFREALAAGKEARSRTAIGGESVSVATAAIAFAKQRLGSLAGTTVLVVGAGKMGTLAAKRLRREGCAQLLVANRSHAKARDVVAWLGDGTAVELPGLVDALQQADVVITSTGAAHFILTPGNVAEAMLARPNRPLLAIDIAVPRDVDPDVARIPNVVVADIDQLTDIVDLTLERRREAIPLVEEIITEHAERFARWYGSRAAVPVVSSLVAKAETIRSGEIERLFARCPELTDRERMLITGATLRIVSKLLHNAVVKLRERAGTSDGEAVILAGIVDELFDLRAKIEAGRSE
ncbi:MAG: glutamyl-tRNA reductase [Candidatus Eremiobacteraeota bacterium]|nr:glutamyl-tRNA reductase [Candidatus Eremiobacteraeota bacterium]MBC5803636.1 glutamyl-tRNA reductase [Candidatus Eremiobacteraeota bacterium]MBC5822116.1 glutamyl-tRNA reductase [Candidatus Eremiobacteraeota bacterium]